MPAKEKGHASLGPRCHEFQTTVHLGTIKCSLSFEPPSHYYQRYPKCNTVRVPNLCQGTLGRTKVTGSKQGFQKYFIMVLGFEATRLRTTSNWIWITMLLGYGETTKLTSAAAYKAGCHFLHKKDRKLGTILPLSQSRASLQPTLGHFLDYRVRH